MGVDFEYGFASAHVGDKPRSTRTGNRLHQVDDPGSVPVLSSLQLFGAYANNLKRTFFLFVRLKAKSVDEALTHRDGTPIIHCCAHVRAYSLTLNPILTSLTDLTQT